MWRPIPYSKKLHLYRCGNLKYLIFMSYLTKTRCFSIVKTTFLLLLNKRTIYIPRAIEKPQMKCKY